MNRFLCTLAALVASLLQVGCEKEIADAPPEIRIGQDVCIHCNMIISDVRHAAASLVRVDGSRKALLFDDIGDMLDYHAAHRDLVVERQYVHDHETKRWLEFSGAHFVHAPEVHTPMGSGLLAFGSEESARSAAKSNGGRQLARDELAGRRSQSTGATTLPCCESKTGR